MFYASVLFTCGLMMTIISNGYGTTMLVAGVITMFIGTVAGLKIECNIDEKKIFEEERFKELKRLVEAQLEQIQLLQEEVDILKQR